MSAAQQADLPKAETYEHLPQVPLGFVETACRDAIGVSATKDDALLSLRPSPAPLPSPPLSLAPIAAASFPVSMTSSVPAVSAWRWYDMVTAIRAVYCRRPKWAKLAMILENKSSPSMQSAFCNDQMTLALVLGTRPAGSSITIDLHARPSQPRRAQSSCTAYYAKQQAPLSSAASEPLD